MRFESGKILMGFGLLCLAVTVAAQVRSASAAAISTARDPQIDAAFERFYNMDYDRATQLFEKILEKHSTDPFAVNHLLSVVLMHELYRTGAMNTGEYANDSFIGQNHHPADPKVKERIRQLVARAEAIQRGARARRDRPHRRTRHRHGERRACRRRHHRVRHRFPSEPLPLADAYRRPRRHRTRVAVG